MTTDGLSATSRRLNSYSVPLDFLRPDLERGLRLEAGIGSVGHTGRASRPRLDLIPHVRQHGTGIVAVLLVGTPRQVRDFVLPRQRHQLVPARMEVHPIDAVAEA